SKGLDPLNIGVYENQKKGEKDSMSSNDNDASVHEQHKMSAHN
ncbi:unnamed protein product, partial [Rotaria magnacalcarata]